MTEQPEVIEQSPFPPIYHLTSALEEETPYEHAHHGWGEHHHVEHEYVAEPVVHPVHHWTEEHHAVEAATAHERHVAEYEHGDELKLRHELDHYQLYGP